MTLVAVVVVACAYQAAVVAAVWLAWRIPPNAPRRTPEAVALPFEDVRFPTVGGKSLHGWWVPAEGRDAPALLLVHGWGRNVERMLPYLAPLHAGGFALLAIDARHHGLSDRDGFASMKKFSEDIRAGLDYLSQRCGASAYGIVGLSIGGAAAIHAAACDPRIRAVVTVGAFAHPAEAMMPPGKWRLLLAPGLPLALRIVEARVGARLDDLAPERSIARAAARFLLIHGARDTVVPVAHASRLARAGEGRAELWIMEARGHSDPHLERGFFPRVRDFLAANLA